VTALLAGPAFGFGAMGGFHGGFHGGGHGGGFHASGFRPPPPVSLAPTPVPPVGAPPPMHIHSRFINVRDVFPHEHFFRHDHRQTGAFWGWPGGWGGGYGVYATGAAEPAYLAAQEPARAAEPPPCPVLLTWSPKLGRATRQRLCDDAA
jgi:hypothetical protein